MIYCSTWFNFVSVKLNDICYYYWMIFVHLSHKSKDPNFCLGSVKWILPPPNGPEMKLQQIFHLLEKFMLLVWKSFVRIEKKKTCLFHWLWKTKFRNSMHIHATQLSAKHINICSCQSSSSLNISNSTALIHTGLMNLPHSSSTNYSWRNTFEAAKLQQASWSEVTLQ